MNNLSTTEPSARPRNLLFVVVDDLNLSLGCYGHPAAHTPNIDRLAAQGLRFSHVFTPYPLCGPARSSMMTGIRPERLGMGINEFCWRDAHPRLRTLTQIAREEGFTTAGFGKIYHHGIPEADMEAWRKAHPEAPLAHTFADPLSWDETHHPKAQVGERQAKGPEQQIAGRPFGGTSLHTIRASNPEVLPDVDVADHAVAFLREKPWQGSRGFVLGVGLHKPHVPLVAPEKWWAFYDTLDVDTLIPPTWHHPAELPEGTLLRKNFHRGTDEEQRRHLYKGYLACTSHMDEQLGRVLDALEASGEADHTLIVFTADHGYHLGEQGSWDKMAPLDPSLRVPLILAGPGIPKHRTCSAQVETLDLFPTLIDLLGLPESQPTDGQNLQTHLQHPARADSRPAFAWIRAGNRHAWTLRTPEFRYGLVSFNQAPPESFLFDLRTDPHESRNRAGDPELRETETRLHQSLLAHFSSTDPIPQ